MTAAGGGRLARLLASLRARGAGECLVHAGATVSGAGLEERREAWTGPLAEEGFRPGGVVGIAADWTPDSIALFLAVLSGGGVAALVSPRDPAPEAKLAEAGASSLFRQADDGSWERRRLEPGAAAEHELLRSLAERDGAGFVVFSSGSEGKPKAVLHDVDRFLGKYDEPGKAKRTLAFLLFDHIAGLDTLFYTLVHDGVLVLPTSRDPEAIAALLESARVEVLPTSPTFLKLFCLAGAAEGRDLSSLQTVAWGSESMPAATLARVEEVLPGVRLLQKFGTSELGSPRSRTRDGDGLWIDFSGMEHRVEDGILWLRSPTAMLGYLNAPNPFDGEGWWCTGDLVEQDGPWLRILGRRSDVINVGGEKVMPREVEEVILEVEGIDDVVVRGMDHPITGQVVEAVVNAGAGADARALRKAVRSHCRARLPLAKVPVKVTVTDEPLATERGKKLRRV